MNGLLIPWPIVLLALAFAAAACVLRFQQWITRHPWTSGALGTTSFSLGVAVFAFFIAGAAPSMSMAWAANDVASTASSEQKESAKAEAVPSPSDDKTTSDSTSKKETPSDAEPVKETTAKENGANASKSAAKAAQAELESPISTVKIDFEKRPKWVESGSREAGGATTRSVSSGPWATQSECDRMLDAKLADATSEYIRDFLKSDIAPHVVNYDLAYIKKHLVPEGGIYHESLTVSFGQMQQAHALLQFNNGFRAELETRWKRAIAGWRLGQTGVLFGGVLVFLGAFFGYFKLDNATRGFYTGRLQLGMAATILTLVAAGIYLAKTFPWL
jgi:hypothetical protein